VTSTREVRINCFLTGCWEAGICYCIAYVLRLHHVRHWMGVGAERIWSSHGWRGCWEGVTALLCWEWNLGRALRAVVAAAEEMEEGMIIDVLQSDSRREGTGRRISARGGVKQCIAAAL
jgi:hypothetical protein